MTMRRFVVLGVMGLVGCAQVDQQRRIEGQQQRIEVLSGQVAALETQHSDAVQRSEALSSERDALSARLDATERENRDLAAQLAELAKRRLEDAAARREAEAELARRAAAEQATRQPTEPAATQPAEAPPTLEASQPTEELPGEGKYHLRVISLPLTDYNAVAIKELADHLVQREGLANVVAHQSGSHWVIDIGPFDSTRSPEAVALRERIRALRYRGRLDFATAYFTRY